MKIIVCQIAIMGVLLMGANSCKKDKDNNPTVTDIDGNVYHTITIGTQVWMVENLKTTKYRNGDPIRDVIDPAAWISDTTGAYCNYNNSTDNANTYGRLYNWFAVNDSRNIAPNGWHVPSDAEWTTLINFLGGEDVAGGKLKETGTKHWQFDSGSTNETGFTALPGGHRYLDGTYEYNGNYGYWWSSAENSNGIAWFREIRSFENLVIRGFYSYIFGYSVRCVKD